MPRAQLEPATSEAEEAACCPLCAKDVDQQEEYIQGKPQAKPLLAGRGLYTEVSESPMCIWDASSVTLGSPADATLPPLPLLLQAAAPNAGLPLTT